MPYFILVAIAFMLAYAPFAAAGDHDHDHHDHHHDEDRIEHYVAVEQPTTKADALALLSAKTAEVAAVLLKPTLSDADLETVHEISYSLEAATDALREFVPALADTIDNLDEAVQAVHYASENHEEAETRTWFKTVRAIAEELTHAH